ncbi:unnamed protein product [Pieris macdunnoughi]|uniref:rRNA methyltransferase n=1 Tax=Pieris macdunnoughi TaxID=345717 RepID=A0A821MRI5_9NEOP|nr:unnamed protein product [Pieris macdunnoughi]
MGKKTKVGKQRKDKYYQLAKETGFRSRAAFKLIQLNRKFGFLQKSRICIDLCAAPGGWMQVAHQNMPLSSIVIGIDLFPIKPIPGCISITEDITTEKCKTAIKKEIKTWKADVVLNDGYIAPDSIDPKLLDAKYVFEDLEIVKKTHNNILHPEKQKKAKAEGYKENDYTTHHKVMLSEFLAKEDPIDLLQECSEIVIDDEDVHNHPKTTKEIKECCKDIKVLGRKDVKAILNWLKHIKESKKTKEPTEEKADVDEKEEDKDEADKEEETIDDEVAELQDEEKRLLKRKRKQLNKQRQKLAEKMNLKMVLKGDDGPILESNDMFRLSDIKDVKFQLNMVIDQAPDIVAEASDSDDEGKVKQKYMKYDVEDSKLDSSGLFYKDSDSELEMESDSDHEDKQSLGFSDSENESKDIDKLTKLNTLRNSKLKATPAKAKKNPLLTDLDDTDPVSRRSMKAELWFQKDSFKDIDNEEDEGVDLDKLAATHKKKGKKVADSNISDLGSQKRMKRKQSDSESSSDDSEYDVEENVAPSVESAGNKSGKGKDGFEVVSQDPELKRLKKSMKMDAETLALGTMIATSKKFKRDLVDDGWNRYAFNDKNLPDWFVEDENKHMKKEVVVPEKFTEEYKNRLQDINARPIKKVVEAKARKKKRMIKKMERAKKKVEAVMDNADMSEREKSQQVRQLYKKAQTEVKKKVTYVVAKKHTTAKRMKRPTGVKGHYKVVDPRMKKDLRAQKAKEKTKGRGKKGNINKNKTKSRPAKKKGKKAK